MKTTMVPIRVVGFCLLSILSFGHVFSHANAPETSTTRCDTSFGKETVAKTIETCRLELIGPVNDVQRVLILETLGKSYLLQNEPDLAIATWNEASQYSSPTHENPATVEAWTRLQV